MENNDKTKEELIEEINTMRQNICELESKIAKISSQQNREILERQHREEINTQIEFIADFDVVEAQGINISGGGICFEIKEDLPFEMRFQMKDQIHEYRAHLRWVKRLPEGGYRFGLKFVPLEPHHDF